MSTGIMWRLEQLHCHANLVLPLLALPRLLFFRLSFFSAFLLFDEFGGYLEAMVRIRTGGLALTPIPVAQLVMLVAEDERPRVLDACEKLIAWEDDELASEISPASMSTSCPWAGDGAISLVSESVGVIGMCIRLAATAGSGARREVPSDGKPDRSSGAVASCRVVCGLRGVPDGLIVASPWPFWRLGLLLPPTP
jgi:hypothetical protein